MDTRDSANDTCLIHLNSPDLSEVEQIRGNKVFSDNNSSKQWLVRLFINFFNVVKEYDTQTTETLFLKDLIKLQGIQCIL